MKPGDWLDGSARDTAGALTAQEEDARITALADATRRRWLARRAKEELAAPSARNATPVGVRHTVRPISN